MFAVMVNILLTSSLLAVRLRSNSCGRCSASLAQWSSRSWSRSISSAHSLVMRANSSRACTRSSRRLSPLVIYPPRVRDSSSVSPVGTSATRAVLPWPLVGRASPYDPVVAMSYAPDVGIETCFSDNCNIGIVMLILASLVFGLCTAIDKGAELIPQFQTKSAPGTWGTC